jgi:hypothetical protein
VKKHLLGALLVSASMASAHFVFVVPQPGGAAAKVFISEDLKPSEEVNVGIIGGAKLSLRDGDGHETSLSLVKADKAYLIDIPGTGTRLVHGIADLGLNQKSTGKAESSGLLPQVDHRRPLGSQDGRGGQRTGGDHPGWHCRCVAAESSRAWPAPAKRGSDAYPADGSQKKLTTAADGLTDQLTQPGRYGAWARFWETVGGERDGKAYAETRNYATLVFDMAQGSPASATRFATLPEKTSSRASPGFR